jgi:hypothetical protein
VRCLAGRLVTGAGATIPQADVPVTPTGEVKAVAHLDRDLERSKAFAETR